MIGNGSEDFPEVISAYVHLILRLFIFSGITYFHQAVSPVAISAASKKKDP